MVTKSNVLILIGFLCVTSACATSRIKKVDVINSSHTDFSAILLNKAARACDGAETFGDGSSFNCDRQVCIQTAHDRTEESCPKFCREYFVCTHPLVCSGSAKFCLEPLVVEFKEPLCPNGIGYYCVGACRCVCSCVEES